MQKRCCFGFLGGEAIDWQMGWYKVAYRTVRGTFSLGCTAESIDRRLTEKDPIAMQSETIRQPDHD